NFRFTQKGNAVYAFYLIPENNTQLPQNLQFSFPKRFKKISVLGSNKAVKFEQKENKINLQTTGIGQLPHAVV
ncbi:hypothetical protein NY599_21500, partial [Enterobacter hormaechei]|nr:hypothetical protein [Enterobacter hormaechei]